MAPGVSGALRGVVRIGRRSGFDEWRAHLTIDGGRRDPRAATIGSSLVPGASDGVDAWLRPPRSPGKLCRRTIASLTSRVSVSPSIAPPSRLPRTSTAGFPKNVAAHVAPRVPLPDLSHQSLLARGNKRP